MSKFKDFLKNFLSNITADPVSSAKGVLQLASGAGAIYAMATGAAPVNAVTVGFATTAIGSGVHALGSNNAAAVEPAIYSMAAGAVPDNPNPPAVPALSIAG